MTAVPAAGAAMSWMTIVWMALLGGLAAPQGVPPLPPHSVLAKIAPEQCVAYLAVSGLAEPDAKSTNQTEQLLAEPEVRALRAQLEQMIRTGLDRQLTSGALPPDVSSGDVADLVQVLMTRPVAVYVAGVEMQPAGMGVRGGLAIHLGDKMDAIKAKVEKIAKILPPQMVQETEIGGLKWHAIRQTPIGPVVWGFRGKYFLAAVGDGELEAMMDRAKGNPPAWLAQLHEQSPIERVATVAYLNLKAIAGVALPMAGPQAAKIASGTGFENFAAVSSITGLDKNGCVSRTLLEIEGQPQGLLGFAGIKPLAAADLAAIPADAAVALAVKISPLGALDASMEAMKTADPIGYANKLRTIGQFEAHFGLKLREEVLRPLGDTLVVYGSAGTMGPPSLVVALQVADSQQAAKSFTKLMQLAEAMFSQGNPTGMKLIKSKVDGKDAYTLQAPMPGVPPVTWCLTEKELVVGLTLPSVQSHLLPPTGFKPLSQTPQVADAINGGPLALLYCDLPQVFDRVYPTLPMAAAMMQHQGISFNPSSLPSANTIRSHLAPLVSVVRKTPSGVELVERYSLPGVSLTSSMPMAVGLLLPAVHGARSAARQSQSINNMKQITLAMLNYEQANGHFPPAYKASKDGKPLLSCARAHSALSGAKRFVQAVPSR